MNRCSQLFPASATLVCLHLRLPFFALTPSSLCANNHAKQPPPHPGRPAYRRAGRAAEGRGAQDSAQRPLQTHTEQQQSRTKQCTHTCAQRAGVPDELLKDVGHNITTIPDGFTAHRQIKKVYAARAAMLESPEAMVDLSLIHISEPTRPY